jgi:AraC-like DNA-binding protein/ligand-binding sensor protein
MERKLDVFYDEEVQRLIDSFAKCFRVRFTIFSADGGDMILGFPYQSSGFCRMVRENLHLLPACQSQNLAMCRKCEIEQEPVMYRCHAGLHEAVMPITAGRENQTLIGYAMIGQFRVKGDKGVKKDFAGIGEAKDASVLKKAYLDLPLYDVKAAQNMVDLFSVLVKFIIMREYIKVRNLGLAEKVSRWLDDHITEQITIDTAAAAVCRSGSSVYHSIKHRYSMSFKQRHTIKSIQYFERLVSAEPNLTISEAALKAGFEDPLYFSRIYKKNRRISPSAFVNKCRKQEGTL